MKLTKTQRVILELMAEPDAYAWLGHLSYQPKSAPDFCEVRQPSLNFGYERAGFAGTWDRIAITMRSLIKRGLVECKGEEEIGRDHLKSVGKRYEINAAGRKAIGVQWLPYVE